MSGLILSLVLACTEPPVAASAQAGVWVEARQVAAEEPIVLHVPAGTELPPFDTLRVTERSLGDDGSRVYELRGAAGSYVLDVPAPSGEPVRFFVDIGVEGPSGGPMEDLASMPEAEAPHWPYYVAAAVGAAAVAMALIRAARSLRPAPPPPPPEPADVRARREWRELRAREDLGAEALAIALSDVYRRYLDATRPWPATSRTTREIVDNLASELTALDLDRARRLLGAMDLVKFSERGAHAALFEGLDTDFDALVHPPPVAARGGSA